MRVTGSRPVFNELSLQGEDDICQVLGMYAGGDINHWRWMSKIRGFPTAGDEQHEQEK